METQETLPIENIETPEISRKDEIAAQKKNFFKKLKIFGIAGAIILALAIIVPIVLRTYHGAKKTFHVEEIPPEEIVVTKDNPEETNKDEVFLSEKYGFSFEYPAINTFELNDEDGKEFSVSVISPETIPTEKVSGFNMIKGYIFTASPLRLSGRNINEVARVKKDWFTEQCPGTALVTPVTDTNIAAHEGKKFEITQCNSSFIVSYIPANNYIYEIIQAYKGDEGFKQKYKLETDFIVESFKLYEDLPEPDPYITYKDGGSKFMFEYPRELSSDCCKVPAPPVKENESQKHIITISEGTNEKSVGFYIIDISEDRLGFEEYANRFETILKDDYKIIKGTTPNGSRETITVGDNIKAYYYKDLSWKDNDYVIFDAGDRKSIISISIQDIDQGILNKILESISFYK